MLPAPLLHQPDAPDVATGTSRTAQLGEEAEVTLETAMSLYDLHDHELFREVCSCGLAHFRGGGYRARALEFVDELVAEVRPLQMGSAHVRRPTEACTGLCLSGGACA